MSDTPNFLTCPGAHELPPPPEEPPKLGPAPETPVFVAEATTEQHAEARPKKPRWRFWILGGVSGIILLLLIPALVALGRAGIAANRAKHDIAGVETHIRNLDFATAQQQLRMAGDELRLARRHVRGVGIWRDLPWTGTQIRGIENAIASGIETLAGVDDLLETARVVAEVVQGGQALTGDIGAGIPPTQRFADLTPGQKEQILARFAAELPRLRLARDKLDLANELWNRIPQSDLAAPVRSALAPLAETIPLMAKTLDTAVPLIEVLVPLAGYPEPRRFLILLQNADEIRPGGGFIGNVGTVTFDAGDMAEFDFQDVYAIDNPVSGVWKETPPEPMRRWLGVPQWFLRDANWSPDFPISADRVLDFYIRESELQQGSPLAMRPDTVVALEPGFFEALLRLTGPITANGVTFDAANFFEKLQFEVEVHFHQQGIPTERRKEIVGRIGEALTAKLFALPASEWPDVLAVVDDALARKDILMYSRDPAFLRILDARGWTGRAKPTDGDFLWVVDANLAALKTDGAMRKRIQYRLDASDPNDPRATVTLRYTNTAAGFGDYRYTRYRSYTRVYVPEGSELLSATGAMKDDLSMTGGVLIPGNVDVTRELGKTVFGAFWSVEPGRTGILEFTYRLPEGVRARLREGVYRLDVQKQPGVDDAVIDLDVLFQKNLTDAVPPEDRNEWGDTSYRYQTDTLRDRVFNVEL